MAMMNQLSFVICIATLIIIPTFFIYFVHDSKPSSKELVVTLDRFNFIYFTDNHNYVVVQFYDSGCDTCKKFAPEFEKAAAIWNKEDPSVVFAKIDGGKEENRILVNFFQANLHPTIQILKKQEGGAHKYNGPLEADCLVDFVKKERGPAMRQLQSAEEVGRLVADKKVVIVGIFPDEFSSEKYENFTILAERLRPKYEYELRHTSDAKLLPIGDYSSVTCPVVKMFKPFDEPALDFPDFDVDGLEKAIEELSAATVYLHDHDSRRNRPYMLKFLNSNDSKVFMVINMRNEAKIDSFTAIFHQVATQQKGNGLRFAIVDLDANRADVLIHGVIDDEVPLLMIRTNDGQSYAKRNIEADEILAWILQVQVNLALHGGKLKVNERSEPQMPVKVILQEVHDTVPQMHTATSEEGEL